MLLSLLCLLSPGTAVWSQGHGRPGEGPRQGSAAPGLDIVVQQGRLSVNVQAADLAEVLAHIGRQAGIRVSPGPSAGTRVSARFADVPLEDGLRRLLRGASLSHLFLYATGPSGSVTIAEVRILGAGAEAPPPSAPLVGSGEPNPESPTGAPLGKGRRQAPTVVEPVQASTPEPELAEPTELTRRVREVFQLGQEMGRQPLEGQDSPPSNRPSSEPGGVGEFAR
jgi:hypothetical protein